jgi:maleamate amidohydrolase
MILSDKSARQVYADLQKKPRPRYGFGDRPALINVDLQRCFTELGTYPGAYETDPRQIEYVNELAAIFRERGFPVIWTHCSYWPNGHDFGVRGLRRRGMKGQELVTGTRDVELDPRLKIDADYDAMVHRRMPSSFFESNLSSLLVFHRIDTLIVTGGSTSGCVRATVVDGLSMGYRTIVPEECVADKHESPHFASLYDMAMKYADVLPVAEVKAALKKIPANSGRGLVSA